MKRVNFNPNPNSAQADLMEQFHQGNAPEDNKALAEIAAGEDDVASPPSAEALRERVVEALKTIYDPEIPVNIYDLGLIYRIDIDDQSV